MILLVVLSVNLLPGLVIAADEKATAVQEDPLVIQAKQVMLEGNYNYAILLLSKLRKLGTEEQKKFAQEYIGVARERSGQHAFARDEYRRFIAEYPDSVEAKRVQQRLSAIIGLENISNTKVLTKGKAEHRKNNNGWSNFGSVSSNYRYSNTVDDAGNGRDSLSLVSVDADLSVRLRTEDLELQYRFSGGHYEDLLNRGSATAQRLRYFYVDASDSDNKYKLRLGRQRSRSGGVIGRFDGLFGSYQFNDVFSLNFVTGYPVDSSRNTSIDSERDFFGISADIKGVWERYDFNVFAIQQKIGNLVDRQAVGGEVRYISDKSSVFALLDYDTLFHEVNAFVLNGNHRFENNSRLNWSLNVRKSPYISTRNALIGQPVDSLQELQLLFLTDDEILDLANDRTLQSKSASIHYSFSYNDDVTLSSSLTWLNLSDAPASGGVPAFTSSGDQYYLDFQASTKSMFFENDTSFAGIRYSKLNTSDILSIYGNTRITWGGGFTLTPKVRVDVRDNSNGTSQLNISPAIKLQYQNRPHILFAETGLIYFVTGFPEFDDQTTQIYFLYLGYRYTW